MASTAGVVVIGGGVVGCSVLYHLAKFGCTDALLLERDELTSGSTWHAAGGMHTINGDPNVAKLQKYTIDLYQEIEKLSGQSTGLHLTGGVMLAATEARFAWLKSLAAKGRYLGIEADIITPERAHELMPLLDPACFVGALHTWVDGHLDPSGATHAYAQAARKFGARIERFTRVEELVQNPDRSWRVVTNKGEILTEHVVNAGGLWAREVGGMVGRYHPVLAMEHMYLLTEDLPEVAAVNARTGEEVLHALDFDGELYLRQERGGMLIGTYEKAGKPWSEDHTPWDFGHELLAPDLERIMPSLEVAFRHFPVFQKAGIKKVVNGPFTFAPDGNPLVGPVRGLPGYWCACGVMAGFSQGGGVGLALANWIIHGDPGFDVWAMDVARFGDWASKAYTNAKVRENYSRRFSIRFPNEELGAGRPLKTTPVYERLKAHGAQFGAAAGLEVPLWYAPPGVSDTFSWSRSTDFDTIGEEVRAVRERVGLIETSGFAKYSVTGRGAAAWLDRLLTCRLPAPGRMTLAPMLKEDGRLIGDFTLAHLGAEGFLLVGSGVAEDYHLRWFEQQLPGDDSVHIASHGTALAGLAIAGPRSRELLARVTGEDVSAETFRFMDVRRMSIGMAPSVLVGRVSYTGDLGYELWCDAAYQVHLLDTLMNAGEPLGLRLFGSRALNSLRLEKGYGSWAREYRPLYSPLEAGLDRFVALGKDASFIGKESAASEKASGGKLRLRVFRVEVDDADAIGDEPIWRDGAVCGWVTSGGFAHGSKVSVALGYVPKEVAEQPDGWRIQILGRFFAARLQPQPLFDADGARLRG
jgi:dimethylglycine dehydrogenase